MGLFRKMTSISTMGAVDFRSAKDRTAAYTHRAAKQSKKQTKLMRQQLTFDRNQSRYYPQPVPQAAPAGWYPAPSDPVGSVRYWDGFNWTGWFKP